MVVLKVYEGDMVYGELVSFMASAFISVKCRDDRISPHEKRGDVDMRSNLRCSLLCKGRIHR